MSKNNVRTIIHQDLVKCKICFHFVPHSLSDEQKETQMHAAQDFIGMWDLDSTFCKPSSQEMRAVGTSTIQSRNIKQWNCACQILHAPKRVAYRSPELRHS